MEQFQTEHTGVATAEGGPGIFGQGDDSVFSPTSTVQHGVHSEVAPGGQTVGEIRRRFRDRLSLPDGVQAFVNGHVVGDETRVHANQTLTFMHKSGEKGTALGGRLGELAGLSDMASITVAHQALEVSQPFEPGQTVGVIRDRYRAILEISPEAHPYCDGIRMNEQHVVGPGQTVVFLSPAGEIGGGDRV